VITAVEIARAMGDHAPTPEQQAVIEAPLEPMLVVAGAGSGKTATMAARVVWLVVNGLVSGASVLGLTFTRKATAELADRINARLLAARKVFALSDDGLPRVATYNGFAAALVRDHGLRVGSDPDAAVISRSGAWQIMTDLVHSWPVDIGLDVRPGTVVARALALAEELRGNLLSVDDARRALCELIELFEEPRTGRPVKEVRDTPVATLRERLTLMDLVEAYQARKRALGVVEFADQVADACGIAPLVGPSLRDTFRLVLLDEFQDTSVAQLGLLADLFGPGHPVLAVGDPKQAIYGWRGASASALPRFRDRFATPDRPVRTLTLTTSWRNDEAVLQAANAVSRSIARDELVPAPRLVARPGASRGEVHVSVTTTTREEAGAIVRWVADRWRPGTTAAVLCRARKQFPPLIREFHERGIPVAVVGLSGLLFTPEVVDVRSALEVVSDPSRGDSMMRLLTNERLGMADLHVLSAWAGVLAGTGSKGTASLAEAVDSPPPVGWCTPEGHELSPTARARISRLSRALSDLRDHAHLPLGELVVAAEQALGIDIEVSARAGVDPVAARARLDAFAARATEYAAGVPRPTLGGFLEWLDAAEANENGLDLAPAEVTSEAVQLLTVHASKGLEWDVVAVAGLSEGQFPSYNTRTKGDNGWLTDAGTLPSSMRGDADSLPSLDLSCSDWRDLRDALEEFRIRTREHRVAEERRLVYVAVTRARASVLLSAARFPVGASRPAPLSRFLDDLTSFAQIPDGFGVAPVPDVESRNPDLEEVRGEYPTTDPAGPRRARLDAAARAVDRALAGLGGLLGSSASSLEVVDALVATAPLTSRERELAEEVRALLAEREEQGCVAEVGPYLSTSAALALVRSPGGFARDLRRPVPRPPQRDARRGTAFHAWLENHFRQPALLGEPDEDMWGEHGDPADLAELQKAFLHSSWASRSPLQVELDLETPVAGHLLRCRIDAVYRESNGVLLVDWKTGAVPRSPADLEHRQLQLAVYRLAYARSTGMDLADVHAAFVHVKEGVTIRAPLMTEAEIEEKFAGAFLSLMDE